MESTTILETLSVSVCLALTSLLSEVWIDDATVSNKNIQVNTLNACRRVFLENATGVDCSRNESLSVDSVVNTAIQLVLSVLRRNPEAVRSLVGLEFLSGHSLTLSILHFGDPYYIESSTVSDFPISSLISAFLKKSFDWSDALKAFDMSAYVHDSSPPTSSMYRVPGLRALWRQSSLWSNENPMSEDSVVVDNILDSLRAKVKSLAFTESNSSVMLWGVHSDKDAADLRKRVNQLKIKEPSDVLLVSGVAFQVKCLLPLFFDVPYPFLTTAAVLRCREFDLAKLRKTRRTCQRCTREPTEPTLVASMRRVTYEPEDDLPTSSTIEIEESSFTSFTVHKEQPLGGLDTKLTEDVQVRNHTDMFRNDAGHLEEICVPEKMQNQLRRTVPKKKQSRFLPEPPQEDRVPLRPVPGQTEDALSKPVADQPGQLLPTPGPKQMQNALSRFTQEPQEEEVFRPISGQMEGALPKPVVEQMAQVPPKPVAEQEVEVLLTTGSKPKQKALSRFAPEEEVVRPVPSQMEDALPRPVADQTGQVLPTPGSKKKQNALSRVVPEPQEEEPLRPISGQMEGALPKTVAEQTAQVPPKPVAEQEVEVLLTTGSKPKQKALSMFTPEPQEKEVLRPVPSQMEDALPRPVAEQMAEVLPRTSSDQKQNALSRFDHELQEEEVLLRPDTGQMEEVLPNQKAEVLPSSVPEDKEDTLPMPTPATIKEDTQVNHMTEQKEDTRLKPVSERKDEGQSVVKRRRIPAPPAQLDLPVIAQITVIPPSRESLATRHFVEGVPINDSTTRYSIVSTAGGSEIVAAAVQRGYLTTSFNIPHDTTGHVVRDNVSLQLQSTATSSPLPSCTSIAEGGNRALSDAAIREAVLSVPLEDSLKSNTTSDSIMSALDLPPSVTPMSSVETNSSSAPPDGENLNRRKTRKSMHASSSNNVECPQFNKVKNPVPLPTAKRRRTQLISTVSPHMPLLPPPPPRGRSQSGVVQASVTPVEPSRKSEENASGQAQTTSSSGTPLPIVGDGGSSTSTGGSFDSRNPEKKPSASSTSSSSESGSTSVTVVCSTPSSLDSKNKTKKSGGSDTGPTTTAVAAKSAASSVGRRHVVPPINPCSILGPTPNSSRVHNYRNDFKT